MTGLMENGRSISVIRKVLPGNSNLAIAQAAITPKTRLSADRDRRHQQRQFDRRHGVGLRQRAEIRPDAARERLMEDGRERQHQKDDQKQQHDRDDGPAHEERLGARRARRALR